MTSPDTLARQRKIRTWNISIRRRKKKILQKKKKYPLFTWSSGFVMCLKLREYLHITAWVPGERRRADREKKAIFIPHYPLPCLMLNILSSSRHREKIKDWKWHALRKYLRLRRLLLRMDIYLEFISVFLELFFLLTGGAVFPHSLEVEVSEVLSSGYKNLKMKKMQFL